MATDAKPGAGPTKRKTWKDRDCGHGKPDWRMTLDIVSCRAPGCFEDKLARFGWRHMTQEELAERDKGDPE